MKYVKDEAVIEILRGLLRQVSIPTSIAPVVYFGASEVLGSGRTLGDEFAGVQRVTKSTRGRLLWVLIHGILLRIMGERVGASVAKLNLGLFLLRGDFVSVTDRILKVRREIRLSAISDQQKVKFPAWLRYFFACSLAIQGLAEIAALVKEKLDTQEFEKAWTKASELETSEGTVTDESPNCTICMGVSRRPTAAKCGHIFCWSCAILCFGKEQKCPSCRYDTCIQELFPLEHYTTKSEPSWKLVQSIDLK